ncbi:MAG: AMP-binding protein [Rhodocyclaceae bacterium]
MEKIWLKSYPPGVPAEIDVNEFRSLGDLFEQSCRRYASQAAYVNMGKAISYAELDRLTGQFAAYLQSELKLPKGARVAVMLPNVLQYPICVFGILRAGYTVVNCNPLYTAPELEHQLTDSGAAVLVVLENFASVAQEALARSQTKHVLVTGVGDQLGAVKGLLVNLVLKYVKKMVPHWRIPGAIRLSDALVRGSRHVLRPVDITHEDVAFLQYTGGTTGIAKGAMLTHRNMIANLQQAHAWIKPFISEGNGTVITPLPMYHIFALTANCLTFMKIGWTNLLITNPRDIPGLIKEMKKHSVGVITGVNTLFNALLHNADFARMDFSALRVAFAGGMAVQRAVAQKWKEVTGVTLIEAYGLTETSPAATINPLDLPLFNGSIGLPVSSTDVSIRDEAGTELGVGKAGELCIRGPQVMAGYFNRPDETAKVMCSDGFLRTGDVAMVDEEGFVRIVDRKKDMILVSGFNVYPNEVEDVVAQHPDVVEVAAVGVPDDRSGEAVKIYVVRRDSSLTAEALIAHCRESLTAYKVPRYVEFRRELPKTNVGKILRRALRDEEIVKHERAA